MKNLWSDPWGWLIALLAGGMTWAVLGDALGTAMTVLLSAAVAAIVMTVRVVSGGMLNRGSESHTSRKDLLPTPAIGSEAALLVRRGERAHARIAVLVDRPGDASLRAQISQVDDGALEAVDALRDLAGRVALAEETLRHSDSAALRADTAQLQSRLAGANDPMLAAELQRALDAASAQSDGLQRIESLRSTLLSRMQTAVYGLEALGTKMSEVVALGTESLGGDRAAAMLTSADTDVESLRAGLSEAQRLARELPGSY